MFPDGEGENPGAGPAGIGKVPVLIEDGPGSEKAMVCDVNGRSTLD